MSGAPTDERAIGRDLVLHAPVRLGSSSDSKMESALNRKSTQLVRAQSKNALLVSAGGPIRPGNPPNVGLAPPTALRGSGDRAEIGPTARRWGVAPADTG